MGLWPLFICIYFFNPGFDIARVIRWSSLLEYFADLRAPENNRIYFFAADPAFILAIGNDFPLPAPWDVIFVPQISCYDELAALLFFLFLLVDFLVAVNYCEFVLLEIVGLKF